MAALANIIINDGQATPVAHTFSPSGPDKNGVSYLADRSGGIPLGYPTMSLDLREPLVAKPGQASSSNRIYKVTLGIIVPTLETATGSTSGGYAPVPQLAYETAVRIEFRLPERSALQSRKDILAYAKNLLGHATVVSMVQDLEAVY